MYTNTQKAGKVTFQEVRGDFEPFVWRRVWSIPVGGIWETAMPRAQPCSVRGAPKPAKPAPPGSLSPPGENQPLQELELCIQLFLLALPFLPEHLLRLFMNLSFGILLWPKQDSHLSNELNDSDVSV